MSNKNIEFSIVIPVFNEEENINELYERVSKNISSVTKSWEIIFVDDGSKDKSVEKIKRLSVHNSKVRYIILSRNFGHQAALTAGLDGTKGKAIITMDSDLQDPPELIPELISEWKKGNDVVYARRRNYRNDNFVKKIGSIAYYKLLDKFSDVKIPRNVGDYRLISRRVLEELKKMNEKNIYLRGSVAWLGFKHSFVDYERKDREKGNSGYTLRKLINLGLEGFLNFTTIPFKIGFILGMLSIISGFLFLGYMLVDSIIYGSNYEFFKFLVVILFIFIGFMFMLFWILGEYLWRVYSQVRSRSSYIITDYN